MHARYILIAAALTLPLAGCGKKPGNTIEKMNAELCATGDISVMQKYVTEKSKPSVNAITALFAEPKKAEKMKAQIKKDCEAGKSKIEIVEEKVEGDKATVTYKQGSKTETAKLVKENGEWKLEFDTKK